MCIEVVHMQVHLGRVSEGGTRSRVCQPARGQVGLTARCTNGSSLCLKGPKHKMFGSRLITPSKPVCVGDFRIERKTLFIARIWCIFGENSTKRMLGMRLIYEIRNIRPEHKKNKFYFLVPTSSTHTGLNCVKTRRRIYHAWALYETDFRAILSS